MSNATSPATCAASVRGAHPERALERRLAREAPFARGQGVVVACSGGPDSVALAGALGRLAPELGIEVRLVHVNHAIRSSALQDECVVVGVAAALELPLAVVRLSGRARSEAAMREERYAALAAAAQQAGSVAVATAHHAEDQAESVLLALFRGTGLDGLAGIPVRRGLAGGIDLVRPLLQVSAERLRAYCHACGLPYGVDPTNTGGDGRRNALRAALVALRGSFPRLDEAVARAARLAADDRDGLPRAGLRRLVRARLAEQDLLEDVDFEHVEAAARALEAGSGGAFLMKPGVVLTVTRGEISGITRE